MNFKTLREIKVYFINLLMKLFIVSSKKTYHRQEKKKHTNLLSWRAEMW